MKHQLVSFSTQILHKNLILHDSAEMSFSAVRVVSEALVELTWNELYIAKVIIWKSRRKTFLWNRNCDLGRYWADWQY